MQFKANNKTNNKIFDFSKYIVYIVFVLVLLLFAITLGGTFFSVSNLLNIIRQTAVISIVAVTMTFVIATGQIDLSDGSTIALTGLVAAVILRSTNSILLAVIAALMLGVLIGAVNGLLIVVLKIPAFLVTLGTQLIVLGFAMWITKTVAVPITNKVFNAVFGGGTVGPVPVLLIWSLLMIVIGHIALNHTSYGKRILATGGNPTSAKYSGINVKKHIVLVMLFNSLAAALGGLLYAGRMATARYSYGSGAELDAIAAVILGGTAMAGGTGSVIGAGVGSLLLGIINNGLIIAGFNSSQQTIIKGVMIIASVALSSVGSIKKES